MPQLTEDGIDVPAMAAEPTLNAQSELVRILGQPWEMLEDWLVYGAENGTRVDFCFDDHARVEVMVRLDANGVSDTLLDAICRLGIQLNCEFFAMESKTLLQPRRDVIAHALATSRAAQFVEQRAAERGRSV